MDVSVAEDLKKKNVAGAYSPLVRVSGLHRWVDYIKSQYKLFFYPPSAAFSYLGFVTQTAWEDSWTKIPTPPSPVVGGLPLDVVIL